MISACVDPTVKHGGGDVMVWGCFAGDTVSDLFKIQGTHNQHGYHRILQQYAIPSGFRFVGLCGKAFKTAGKALQVKLVERMPRVCKAVIKAKDGYFEELKK